MPVSFGNSSDSCNTVFGSTNSKSLSWEREHSCTIALNVSVLSQHNGAEEDLALEGESGGFLGNVVLSHDTTEVVTGEEQIVAS